MFCIFIEGANEEIDYSQVYALCTDGHELHRELEVLDMWGTSYDWRAV